MKSFLLPGVLILSLQFISAAHADEALGRLFFTPAERDELSQQRRQINTDKEQTSKGRKLSLDGRVTRSDGKTVEWINGEPSAHQAQARTRSLKVGESLDQATGAVQDGLNGGRVTVNGHAGR